MTNSTVFNSNSNLWITELLTDSLIERFGKYFSDSFGCYESAQVHFCVNDLEYYHQIESVHCKTYFSTFYIDSGCEWERVKGRERQQKKVSMGIRLRLDWAVVSCFRFLFAALHLSLPLCVLIPPFLPLPCACSTIVALAFCRKLFV